MLHITCLLYRIKRTKVLVNLVNLIRLRMFKLNVLDDLKYGKYDCYDFKPTLNRHAQTIYKRGGSDIIKDQRNG